MTGKSVANKASLDSRTLINPTGTPIIASTTTFFSLIKSRRWNKAVGAPPKANTLGPSISVAFSTAAIARVIFFSLASWMTSSSLIKQR